MKFLSVAVASTFAALLAITVDAAFRSGDFVLTKNLATRDLDGCYGSIVKTSEENLSDRAQVLILKKQAVLEYDPSREFLISNFFAYFLIKNEKLTKFGWNRPRENTIDDIFNNGDLSSWAETPLSEEDRELLRRVAHLLFKICGGNPENILRDKEVLLKARLLGAWINQNYLFTGMVFACESIGVLRRYLERAWDGIGVWQA